MAAAERGWRAAICLRRGHLGAPLTSARFNLLGCTNDFRAQVAAAIARHPRAPLVAYGASAGSGVVVRYLGEEADRAPFAAAVAVCPGYDTGPGKALSRIAPLLSKQMLRAVRSFFLNRGNAPLLEKLPGYADCAAGVTNMADFQAAAYALEGYSSIEEMYERSNAIPIGGRISVPLCLINAADDPVCTVQARAARPVRDLPVLARVPSRSGMR